MTVPALTEFAPPAGILGALTTGAVAVSGDITAFRIEGPGALDCLQGLLTNDLVGPGDSSLVYGALLTPKGMIVVDGWVVRLPGHLLFLADSAGREPAKEIFRRSLPPRLARVTDRSAETSALWLLGPAWADVLPRAGIEALPAAGVARALDDGTVLAAGTAAAPFAAILVGDTAALERRRDALLAAGATPGDAAALAAARILRGWPTLGREIDDRTLPQEVRFDELGGVSYSKGCYTGQETVARVHFRGHVNRILSGLVFPGAEPLEERTVSVDGREVGLVASVLRSGDRLLALAKLRREVTEGTRVTAGSRSGQVIALPFGSDAVGGA